MTELLPGLRAALADRYAIERELGRGGMATVYLAHDLKHKRQVAFKVLDPELGAVLGIERFRREIETAAQLQHPHILPVHDSGEAAGRLWYTMPYVEGESLRDRLKREGRLSVPEAVRLGQEIAGALQAAHDRGIVHRDVKPGNVLLSHGHALVADFGIARSTSAGGQAITHTGLSLGTPAYMAPEQALGERDLDGRADQYALACLMYELLTGHPPYSGPTSQSIIAKHISEPVPFLRQARSDAPRSVEAAVARAMAKNPRDRFPSAAAFTAALASPAPSTATVPVAAATPARARRRSRALAGGVVLVLAGVAAFALWMRHGTAHAGSPVRLAVLPFENLGDTANAYFVDGVSDAVRGKLTMLAGLQVIARGSSIEYRRTTKRPQEIGRELGVRYLLTGTVRWATSAAGAKEVEVSPELVELTADGAPTSRWQQSFDAAITDVFQVQAEIAERVAGVLNVGLGAGLKATLATPPTRSLAAYDAFLKGEAASQGSNVFDSPALQRAIGYYEQAVTLDTAFVLAWARLGQARAFAYAWSNGTRADAEAARAAADRARTLAPRSPDVQLTLGIYQMQVRADATRALEEYRVGLERAPANADLLGSAAVAEATLGRFDAALTHVDRALSVDPRSLRAMRVRGNTLLELRRWAEARSVVDRALVLAPDNLLLIHLKIMTFLSAGDLAGARAVLHTLPQGVDRAALVAFTARVDDLYWVLDEEQQRMLLSFAPDRFDGDRAAWGLALAHTYWLRGDRVHARAYADSARVTIEGQLRTAPDTAALHAAAAVTLAYLGRAGEAIVEANRAAELGSRSTDVDAVGALHFQLGRIYTLVSQPDSAIDRLRQVLATPWHVSRAWLRIDPTFRPLRGNPRFAQLVAGK